MEKKRWAAGGRRHSAQWDAKGRLPYLPDLPPGITVGRSLRRHQPSFHQPRQTPPRHASGAFHRGQAPMVIPSPRPTHVQSHPVISQGHDRRHTASGHACRHPARRTATAVTCRSSWRSGTAPPALRCGTPAPAVVGQGGQRGGSCGVPGSGGKHADPQIPPREVNALQWSPHYAVAISGLQYCVSARPPTTRPLRPTNGWYGLWGSHLGVQESKSATS